MNESLRIQTDDVLIQRCIERDTRAFQELVERYKKASYSFAFSYLRNQDDALAVSQDAFVRAWKSIETFEIGRRFKPWLFTIVKNLALNFIEKRKNRREMSIDQAREESGFDLEDGGALPDEEIEREELKKQVWDAVFSLKDEFREILILKHFEDMSYSEIAETLSIPEGTVMSRLYHARLALKKHMSAEFKRG